MHNRLKFIKSAVSDILRNKMCTYECMYMLISSGNDKKMLKFACFPELKRIRDANSVGHFSRIMGHVKDNGNTDQNF